MPYIITAAGSVGTIFSLSSYATSTIEEVAAHSPETLKFFQLYIVAGDVGKQIAMDLVRKAEKYGYKAIMLTVDSPQLGVRYNSLRNQFRLPPHLRYSIWHILRP